MSPGSSDGSRSAIVLSTTAAGTINHTARGFSSFLTRSTSEEDPVAFSLAISLTASGDMSKTTQSWPPLSRRRTMLARIRPRPIIPSCIWDLLFRKAYGGALADQKVAELISAQIADAFDCHVGSGSIRAGVGGMSKLPLPRQHCGHPVAPNFLYLSQNSRLVVHQNVAARGVALLDISQLLLLVDVYQHVSLDGLEDAGALDLARLEDDIPIGKDHRPRPASEALENIERSRVEPIGEGVIHQIRRHRQQMDVLRVLDPIALQGAEIVPVAQIAEQLLEDRPIAVATRRSELAFEMALEIGLDAIVVEQGVVDIDKEDGLVRRNHRQARVMGWMIVGNRSRFVQVMRIVPQSDDRLGEVVLVAKHAEGCGAEHEITPARRFEAEPARGEHPQNMGARKHQDVALNGAYTMDYTVGPRAHLVRRLPSGAAVPEQCPIRALLQDL